MRAHRLSLSKLWLAHACLYSFRPDVPVYHKPVGEPALVGQAFHKLAECHVKGKSVTMPGVDIGDAIGVAADALDIYNGPSKAFLDSRKWTACEIGLTYNAAADTCKPGPRRGEPGYDDVAAMTVRGTLDLVHVEGDVAFVPDLKTGRHPDDSSQLYGQAVCVSRHYRVSTVKVAYARCLKTKFELVAEEILDADRLDCEAGRIASLLRRLPTAEPHRGEWCWRCPAREKCPAWVAGAA